MVRVEIELIACIQVELIASIQEAQTFPSPRSTPATPHPTPTRSPGLARHTPATHRQVQTFPGPPSTPAALSQPHHLTPPTVFRTSGIRRLG